MKRIDEASLERPDPPKVEDELKARFATPIDADRPVNQDAGSTAQFSDLPPAEEKVPKPQ
jgi:hypothetical protein